LLLSRAGHSLRLARRSLSTPQTFSHVNKAALGTPRPRTHMIDCSRDVHRCVRSCLFFAHHPVGWRGDSTRRTDAYVVRCHCSASSCIPRIGCASRARDCVRCAGILCFIEYLTEWPCDTLTGLLCCTVLERSAHAACRMLCAVTFLYLERIYHTRIAPPPGTQLPARPSSRAPEQQRLWQPNPLPKPPQPLVVRRVSSHNKSKVKVERTSDPESLPDSPAPPCKALAQSLRDRAHALSSEGKVHYLLAACLLLAFKILDDEVPKNIEWQKGTRTAPRARHRSRHRRPTAVR
jgi:hypothetical protein